MRVTNGVKKGGSGWVGGDTVLLARSIRTPQALPLHVHHEQHVWRAADILDKDSCRLQQPVPAVEG